MGEQIGRCEWCGDIKQGSCGCPAEAEIEKLRAALTRMDRMHGLMMAKVNHGASFYDAECLQEMNEAPIQAARALGPNV